MTQKTTGAALSYTRHDRPSHCTCNISSRNKRPVFVVGCPRSGTTLLHHMLLSAGNFAVYRTETQVFSTLAPRFGNLNVARNRDNLVEHWLRSDMFTLSGLNAGFVRERVKNACHNAGDFLRIVMEGMARQQRVDRWVDDTPEHLLHILEIKKCITDALVIHIIRDGRDVALSLAKQGWIRPLPWDQGITRTLVAALHWEWMVGKGRKAGRSIGRDYLEVRYEDLIQIPQATLNRIGSFIDHTLDYEQIQQVGIGSVKHPNTSFAGSTNGFIGRWKQQLSAEQAARLELMIGGFLQDLGYEISPGRETPDLQVRTVRALYHFYFSFRHWLKIRTPLSRYLVALDILRPGAVINHSRSLSWPGADTSQERQLGRGEQH